VDDGKKGEEVDMLEERATLQRDLKRLENSYNRCCKRFNKEKCKVHPGRKQSQAFVLAGN